MLLKEEELKKIEGGTFKLTAAFLNAAIKCVTKFMEISRTAGSVIRRLVNNNLCPL